VSRRPIRAAQALLLCWFAMFAGPAWGEAPADADSRGEGVPVLLVQNARAMTFDGELLTLEGLAPSTLFFADRPERIVGHMTNEELLAAWSEGEDGFAEDPPNAALSVLGEDGSQVAIVELREPSLSGDAITYKVRVLEGEPPRSAGATALFIDRWRGGPHRGAGPRPNGGWWPGWRACHWNRTMDRRICRW
jgi:hypothetical protein